MSAGFQVKMVLYGKSWQNVTQKCMKPRGYRGVVPFDTFENPTKINKEI